MLVATKVNLKPGQLLIDGQWVEGSKQFDTINPATGEVLTQIAEASATNVDRRRLSRPSRLRGSHGPWRKLSASERGRLIWKLADLVEKNIDELSELETLDNGKPIFESRYVDMPMVIDVLRYFAGLRPRSTAKPSTRSKPPSPTRFASRWASSALIVPWNFPLLLASWKLGPALACGNTLVLKPAEQTPLTALASANLPSKPAFLPGVLNILTGVLRPARPSSPIPVSTRSHSPARLLSARKSCAAQPIPSNV